MAIIHENKWPWGKTASIIADEGAAIVEMSFDDNDPGVCYLSGLSVIPEKRRQGLATNLMYECEYYCIRRGIFRIDLNSVQEPFVIDFYHKLGYTDIKENDGYMRMYKMLKNPTSTPLIPRLSAEPRERLGGDAIKGSGNSPTSDLYSKRVIKQKNYGQKRENQ